MAKQGAVKVSEEKTEEAIIRFLNSLLEKGVVEALLIPKGLPSGDGFVQTLIRDPGKDGWGMCSCANDASAICKGCLQSLHQKFGEESWGSIKSV